MKEKIELTKPEREWISKEILRNLISFHKISEEVPLKKYRRRDEILENRKVTEETWNWDYDIPKKELKIMKSLHEKLTKREG